MKIKPLAQKLFIEYPESALLLEFCKQNELHLYDELMKAKNNIGIAISLDDLTLYEEASQRYKEAFKEITDAGLNIQEIENEKKKKQVADLKDRASTARFEIAKRDRQLAELEKAKKQLLFEQIDYNNRLRSYESKLQNTI